MSIPVRSPLLPPPVVDDDGPEPRRSRTTVWFVVGLVAVVIIASFWAGSPRGETIEAAPPASADSAASTVLTLVAAAAAPEAPATTVAPQASFAVTVSATRVDPGKADLPTTAAEGPYLCFALVATNRGGEAGSFWLSDLFLVDAAGTVRSVSTRAAGSFPLVLTAPGTSTKGEACFPTFHVTGHFVLEQRSLGGAVLATWPVDL